MKKSGVRRLSKAEWLSVTDDPQFEFRFRFIRPRFLLLHLEALDHALEPTLYFDRGYGFSEDDLVSLPHVGPLVVAISLPDLPNVIAVRLDPAARPLKFRFWARTVFRPASLNVIAAKLATASVRAGVRPPIWLTVGNEHDIAPKIPGPSADNVNKHLAYISKLSDIEFPSHAAERQTDAHPLFSIVVPVHDTPRRYLLDLVHSFERQGDNNAELVIVDDGSTSIETRKTLAGFSKIKRITCVSTAQNLGIAATINKGIGIARGRWIGFMDHDDALVPNALKRIRQAIQRHPEGRFFYTDEIVADQFLEPKGYILKPTFDPVLLSGVNYINHFCLFDKSHLDEIGGLRLGFDGSQDYDLLLRYLAGLSEDQIVHIPYPAYLWRRGPETYSMRNLDRSVGNARRALNEHFSSPQGDVPVEAALDRTLHRPRFDAAIRQWPPVTVVIPSRNAYDLISRVLSDLKTKTEYPDLEVIVVDNGSDDERVTRLYDEMERSGLRFKAIVEHQPFNFARQVNVGIRQAGARHVLLLNNDIEVTEADWLQEMVSCLAYPNTGIVGVRLLYPDRTIQHAGVVVGLGGLAGHWFERKSETYPGPFGRLRVRQSLSAVTAACMLIGRPCLEAVGEFDEHHFSVAYNDVDYCLRASSRGFRTVWTPHATLIHHESVSRGSDESPHNRERFAREKDELRKRHRTGEFIDPYFNPWYTKDRSEPGLLLLDKLPDSRGGHFGRVNNNG